MEFISLPGCCFKNEFRIGDFGRLVCSANDFPKLGASAVFRVVEGTSLSDVVDLPSHPNEISLRDVNQG